MPFDFHASRVSVGQVVLWSYGPNERPSPAIVTAVGQQGTINCLCHVDSVKDHVGKTGVRHRDDPFVKAHPAHDAGVWQLTPRDVAIDALLDRATALDHEDAFPAFKGLRGRVEAAKVMLKADATPVHAADLDGEDD